MWRKICCAIDFSARSDAIVHAAAELARSHDAGLVLLNVHELVDESALYSQPEVVQAAHSQREYALQEARRAAAAVSGGPVEATVLSDHHAVTRVVEFARAAECDLIVVGARAESRHSPLESFAEKVVRRAPCSVLVIRSSAEAKARPQPTDGSRRPLHSVGSATCPQNPR